MGGRAHRDERGKRLTHQHKLNRGRRCGEQLSKGQGDRQNKREKAHDGKARCEDAIINAALAATTRGFIPGGKGRPEGSEGWRGRWERGNCARSSKLQLAKRARAAAAAAAAAATAGALIETTANTKLRRATRQRVPPPDAKAAQDLVGSFRGRVISPGIVPRVGWPVSKHDGAAMPHGRGGWCTHRPGSPCPPCPP